MSGVGGGRKGGDREDTCMRECGLGTRLPQMAINTQDGDLPTLKHTSSSDLHT